MTFRRWHPAAPALQALVALFLCAAATRAQPQAQELRVKAAFVSKFPEFTEWPTGALGNRTTLEICVARSGPFHAELSELIRGVSLQGRMLVSRAVDDAAAIDTCHLLFVPTLSLPIRQQFLAEAAVLPVLTVSDAPGFLDDGGMVQLRLVDGRVRFDVNLGAARRAQLRLHSQLLRLARQVRGGPS